MLGGLQPGNLGVGSTTQMDPTAEHGDRAGWMGRNPETTVIQHKEKTKTDKPVKKYH